LKAVRLRSLLARIGFPVTLPFEQVPVRKLLTQISGEDQQRSWRDVLDVGTSRVYRLGCEVTTIHSDVKIHNPSFESFAIARTASHWG
jgi:hypothetical protein